MDDKDRRDVRIAVRLNKQEKEELDAECERLGLSHSKYFRKLHRTYLNVEDPSGLTGQAYREGLRTGATEVAKMTTSFSNVLVACADDLQARENEQNWNESVAKIEEDAKWAKKVQDFDG